MRWIEFGVQFVKDVGKRYAICQFVEGFSGVVQVEHAVCLNFYSANYTTMHQVKAFIKAEP